MLDVKKDQPVSKKDRVVLSRHALKALVLLLDQQCETVMRGNAEIAEYKPGWSDNKVVEVLRKDYPEVNELHVTHYRRTVYGPIIRVAKEPKKSAKINKTSLYRVTSVVHALCELLGEHELQKRLKFTPPSNKPAQDQSDMLEELLHGFAEDGDEE